MRRITPLALALLTVACTPSVALEPTTTTTIAIEETTSTTSPAAMDLTETTVPVPFELTSPAFSDDGLIPAEHTCDGADVSPRLDVTGLPVGTDSVVVVVEDPDAAMGTWEHWVVFDVPAEPTTMQIPDDSSGGGVSGANSWNVSAYKGPCPPEGEEHRYFFTLYALSDTIGLPEGVDSAAVYEAMEPYLISSAELMGRYAR